MSKGKKFLEKVIASIAGLSLFFFALSCGNNTSPTIAGGSNTGGTVTDIDGNVYHTVTIGTQTWTVENLQTTKYNDGAAITKITDSAAWYNISIYNLTTPAYCYYDNTTNADSIKKFGVLYNWYAVNTGKLAPAGWHVPTDADWTKLENYLIENGYNWDGTTSGNKIAKSLAAKTDWATNSISGTVGCDMTKNNSSGFSALPGGIRHNYGSFKYHSDYGYWWSATEDDASRANYRYLSYGSGYFDRGSYRKDCGFSVRLVRD